jgi:hypothetical protein
MGTGEKSERPREGKNGNKKLSEPGFMGFYDYHDFEYKKIMDIRSALRIMVKLKNK